MDVELPLESFGHSLPEYDQDCFRFTVDTIGVLTVDTDDEDDPGCVNYEFYSTLYLLSADAESIWNYLVIDYGGGTCASISFELAAGTYIVCHENDFSWAGNQDELTMDISFKPYACGNDLLEPGEECDGVPQCTPECFFDDGVPREDEVLGNGSPDAPGVKVLTLDEKSRGNIGGSDVDWWSLPLPGDLGIGAVRVFMTGIEDTGCGTAGSVRVDVFGLDDLTQPAATSTVMAPCRATTLTALMDEPVFGNEQLFVRVTSTTPAFATYTLLPTYIVEDCGNDVIEPSEDCEPSDPDLGDRCDTETCRLLPPNNETCAEAQAIEIVDDGTPTLVSGDLRGAANDGDPTSCPVDNPGSCSGNCGSYDPVTFCYCDDACLGIGDCCEDYVEVCIEGGTGNTGGAAPSGVEVYYSFIPPVDGTVRISVAAEFDVKVYALDACGAPTDDGCTEESGGIKVDVTAGDPVIVVVDGAGEDDVGAFELSVGYVFPGEGATCQVAVPLSASSGSVVGTLESEKVNDYDPSSIGDCTGWTASGYDMVYVIDVPAGATLDVVVEVPDDSFYMDFSLYAVSACPIAGNVCLEGADQDYNMESIVWTNTGTTTATTWIVVDTYTTSSVGDFVLTWQVN